jgi:hypothetical protein
MFNVFKGNARSVLCGICCAAVVIGSVEDVKGMEKEIECISERGQFFQITEKLAQGVAGIYFENQEIDEDIRMHWDDIFIGHNFESIGFIHCHLWDSNFDIFNSITVENLIVSDCGITAKNAERMLLFAYPYKLRSIDFSCNKLGENEVLFKQILLNNIYGIMGLSFLNLKDNEFSQAFIDDIINFNKMDSNCSISVIDF